MDQTGVWKVSLLHQGLPITMYANFVFNGQGVLVEPNIPAIPGLASFQGKVMHTAQWDPSYQVAGKRVAVVGCGASVIQALPILQRQASHLVHFQRTPSWVMVHLNQKIPVVVQRLYHVFPLLQVGLKVFNEILENGHIRGRIWIP